MSYIKIENDILLEQLVKENKVVVIDFWAEWCGPCKMFAPIFEEVSKDFKDKAIFAKIDVDKNNDLAEFYKIRSIPTILFIKNGLIAKTKIGSIHKKELIEIVEELLK